MLKTLVKKQLMEAFRSYFYDAKKNRTRSKGSVIAMFAFFALVMIGLLGGMFTYLAITLCVPFSLADMGWLYFVLMSGISVLLGAFGSVFNTFSGLYLSKDNDLLLSMPIPVKDIIASRLLSVYIMGALYSGVVMIPSLIVYWIMANAAPLTIICGIILLIIITLIVLVLSCFLGWCVAKISSKLKNKSFITVALALLFIAAYYFFYFKAQNLLNELLGNVELIGTRIKGSAYVLYLFGKIGEGDLAATAIFALAIAVILLITWLILRSTFLSIATAAGSSAESRAHREHAIKEKSVFSAFLSKELSRFTSSPSYMLNCGLGVLLIPACGVMVLIKGSVIFEAFNSVFGSLPGAVGILMCTVLLLACTMNDIAAPSVSLEGKSIWIPQSLPVDGKTVLMAKAVLQMLLTGIPMLFTAFCLIIVFDLPAAVKILIPVVGILFVIFMALFSSFIGVKLPVLNWTNEIMPIKQSAAVMISLFGGFIIAGVFAGVYLIFAESISAVLYLVLWAVFLAVMSVLLLRWLGTRGAKLFSEL